MRVLWDKVLHAVLRVPVRAVRLRYTLFTRILHTSTDLVATQRLPSSVSSGAFVCATADDLGTCWMPTIPLHTVYVPANYLWLDADHTVTPRPVPQTISGCRARRWLSTAEVSRSGVRPEVRPQSGISLRECESESGVHLKYDSSLACADGTGAWPPCCLARCNSQLPPFTRSGSFKNAREWDCGHGGRGAFDNKSSPLEHEAALPREGAIR